MMHLKYFKNVIKYSPLDEVSVLWRGCIEKLTFFGEVSHPFFQDLSVKYAIDRCAAYGFLKSSDP